MKNDRGLSRRLCYSCVDVAGLGAQEAIDKSRSGLEHNPDCGRI